MTRRRNSVSISSQRSSPHLRRTAIACAVAHLLVGVAVLLPGVMPMSAYAQTSDAVKTYSIPAGPLTTVLNRFGRDAGVMLSFSTDVTNGLQSKGISGSHTVSSALRGLLSGTGLDVVRQANGGYTLQATQQSLPPDAKLPVVNVVGAANEDPFGPVNGYLAKRTATGTKTDTSILEVPQSISVVGRAQMEDQKAQNIQDALGYTAGVMTGISAKSPIFDDTLSIRGFEANPQNGSYYRDGLRYMVNLYNGKQEVYGLERVEVLKGPSSILYGAAAPGGIVNTVTKRPTATPLREINVEYGSNDRKQLSADFGGPIDDDGIWSYRLTALERKSDTDMDYGRDDRTYIASALTWKPSAVTSLTLLASYQNSDAFVPPTVPLTGSLLPNPNGQVARTRFLGEPNHNKFETNTSSVGYLFEHAFSDTLKVRNSFRYYESDLTLRYVLITGDVDTATKRRVPRSARGFDDDTSMFTMDTYIEQTFVTGAVKHTVLVGVDYTNAHYDSVRTRGTLGTMDVYNPVYQTGAIVTGPYRQFATQEKKLGAYLQDQLKIDDKWVVLLGGRYDHVRMINNVIHAPATSTDEKDSAFTGRAGLVYLADNGFAPYASFTQSFEPTSGLDVNDQRYKPSEGQQYEVGVRYQPPGSDALFTASLFDLTRTNVQTPAPGAPGELVQSGEVRSRGLELEAKTSAGRYVDLIGAYTYTDAKVTRSNNPVELGERFNSPKNIFSLWMNAKLGFMNMPNWRAGAGVRYVSDRPDRKSIPANGGPAYTLLDARLGYENGPWLYALNVTNLTDKIYVPSMCYSGSCDYGAARQITGTMTYRW